MHIYLEKTIKKYIKIDKKKKNIPQDNKVYRIGGKSNNKVC